MKTKNWSAKAHDVVHVTKDTVVTLCLKQFATDDVIITTEKAIRCMKCMGSVGNHRASEHERRGTA